MPRRLPERLPDKTEVPLVNVRRGRRFRHVRARKPNVPCAV